MNDADLARKVLTGAFPQECEAVGQSSIEDVISGVDIVAPEEGRPFPIHDVLQFLKDIAELVLALIPIIKFLWNQNKKKPTLPEVRAETAKRGVKHGKISDDQVNKTIKEILKDTNSIKDLND